jgi:hypothetical protein
MTSTYNLLINWLINYKKCFRNLITIFRPWTALLWQTFPKSEQKKDSDFEKVFFDPVSNTWKSEKYIKVQYFLSRIRVLTIFLSKRSKILENSPESQKFLVILNNEPNHEVSR